MQDIKKIIWSSPQEFDILDASTQLLRGELIGIPTETVYGLAADAENETALEKIFLLKGRPFEHPVIVHIPYGIEINYWASEISLYAEVLMEAFWPGPLTLLFKKKSHVLDMVTGGQQTVGLRCPNHPVTQLLLQKFAELKGNPNSGLAAPSANYFGKLSPTRAVHVFEEFNGQVSVLDGGECAVGIESTIVDVTSEIPRILRPGKISEKDIFLTIEARIKKKNIGKDFSNSRFKDKSFSNFQRHHGSDLFADKQDYVGRDERIFHELDDLFLKTDLRVRVSGCLESHYAPKTPLYLFNIRGTEIFTRFEAFFLMMEQSIFSDRKFDDCFMSQSFSSLKPFDEIMKDFLFSHPSKLIALALTHETYEKLLSFFYKKNRIKKFAKLNFRYFFLPKKPDELAFGLYNFLRELDKKEFQQIWFERPPKSVDYIAVDDRLIRASKKIIG